MVKLSSWPGRGEADIQFHAGDAEGDLARAGVAKAARPQRDVDFVGFAFDKAMIEGFAVFVVKIDSDRAASSLAWNWVQTNAPRAPRCCVSWR